MTRSLLSALFLSFGLSGALFSAETEKKDSPAQPPALLPHKNVIPLKVNPPKEGSPQAAAIKYFLMRGNGDAKGVEKMVSKTAFEPRTKEFLELVAKTPSEWGKLNKDSIWYCLEKYSTGTQCRALVHILFSAEKASGSAPVELALEDGQWVLNAKDIPDAEGDKPAGPPPSEDAVFSFTKNPPKADSPQSLAIDFLVSFEARDFTKCANMLSSKDAGKEKKLKELFEKRSSTTFIAYGKETKRELMKESVEFQTLKSSPDSAQVFISYHRKPENNPTYWCLLELTKTNGKWLVSPNIQLAD